MKTKVIGEYGYKQALFGLGLSYGHTSNENFEEESIFEIIDPGHWVKQMKEVSEKLAHKDGGHNKFLESIQLWLDITAPRYWWQEFDTYRVGTTKQSESTMHTITKRKLNATDFECNYIPGEILNLLNAYIGQKYWLDVKKYLPESFLQRRIVNTNYKVLRNIILQRRNHKMELWQEFIKDVLKQIDHPELLPGLEDNK